MNDYLYLKSHMRYTAILGIFFLFIACKPASKQPGSSDTSSSDKTIIEKYWKLIELNGNPVTVDSSMRREPHIILKSAENRVNGNGGCNTLAGTYELKEGNRISFGQMISTKMACPEMQTETDFLNVLQQTDNYSLNGDTLTLNKARMSPLAVLIAVYMK